MVSRASYFGIYRGMEDMPTFTPSGGQPLLVRGTIQENFEDKMPLTSRYAWPRSASSLSTSSFPSRNSKNPFFARHNPHPQRVRHMKGLLNVPVCTVIDSPGAEEDVGRYMVGTPTIDQMRQRPLKSNQGLRLPINADSVVFAKEKAVPTIGLGKTVTFFNFASINHLEFLLSNVMLLSLRLGYLLIPVFISSRNKTSYFMNQIEASLSM